MPRGPCLSDCSFTVAFALCPFASLSLDSQGQYLYFLSCRDFLPVADELQLGFSFTEVWGGGMARCTRLGWLPLNSVSPATLRLGCLCYSRQPGRPFALALDASASNPLQQAPRAPGDYSDDDDDDDDVDDDDDDDDDDDRSEGAENSDSAEEEEEADTEDSEDAGETNEAIDAAGSPAADEAASAARSKPWPGVLPRNSAALRFRRSAKGSRSPSRFPPAVFGSGFDA